MRLVTIQNKKILELLLKGITYKNDFEYVLGEIDDCYNFITQREYSEITRAKAYQILMRHYRYTTPPIFCCIVQRIVNFTGTTKSNRNILLELEVPDEFINLHKFDTWQYIFHLVYRNDWNDALYETLKEYLDGKDTGKEYLGSIQAVIPFIKPDWLKGAYKITNRFIDLYEEEYLYENNYNWKPLYIAK